MLAKALKLLPLLVLVCIVIAACASEESDAPQSAAAAPAPAPAMEALETERVVAAQPAAAPAPAVPARAAPAAPAPQRRLLLPLQPPQSRPLRPSHRRLRYVSRARPRSRTTSAPPQFARPRTMYRRSASIPTARRSSLPSTGRGQGTRWSPTQSVQKSG